jgi:hypothetical protein
VSGQFSAFDIGQIISSLLALQDRVLVFACCFSGCKSLRLCFTSGLSTLFFIASVKDCSQLSIVQGDTFEYFRHFCADY